MRLRPMQSLATLLLLSACALTPSDESREMEKKLVPSMLAWSRSGVVFELQGATRKHGAVCILPEYNCLGDKSAVQADEFHSSFGRCVPENHSALVLVAN